MTMNRVPREILADGSVGLAIEDTSFTFRRLRADTLLVRVIGYDRGQFGRAPLDEMAAALDLVLPLEIFVDARAAIGVTTAVREEWTEWFQTHRGRLKKIHVLVLGKFMSSVVNVSQHLARVGSLIQVYGDAERFEQALGRIVLAG
jgi:hypothetical protein